MEKNKSFYPAQTVYGTQTRYEWFKKFLTSTDKIVDIGCGTGVMITIPLMQEHFDITGLDLDENSIGYGKKLLETNGIEKDRLLCKNFSELAFAPNKIILSQVLEHLNNKQVDELLILLFERLPEGGQLLITVPHGYGWFEFESFLWYKIKLGKIISLLRIEGIKRKVFGINSIEEHPSSLDSSPHVQRFTYFSLPKMLKKYGFQLKELRGGSLISGPFSNVFFTGFNFIMQLNMFLGRKFPIIASDLYIAVEKPYK